MRLSFIITAATGLLATAIASSTGGSAQLARADSALTLTSADKNAIKERDVSLAMAETVDKQVATRQKHSKASCMACLIICPWGPILTCRACKKYCGKLAADLGDLVDGIPTIGGDVKALGNTEEDTVHAIQAVEYITCLGQGLISNSVTANGCAAMKPETEGELTGISEPLNAGLTQVAAETLDMLSVPEDPKDIRDKIIAAVKCFLCYTECVAKPDLVKCSQCGLCELGLQV
ncbi:uncharacterized protein EI97DRAFT_461203 [Westerdykella ornata]|uniref:Uncharacterized protein n=1 Tax=Westerdykella ornata TaxID=318751 RepID=A0A6A6J9S4_WESOR|nr:uncharacterized protein EI97DRAFT_461203 [Westerdykella ornata]KAF2273321.1 hypothetical protein EI97DRAFT_461203 [Westerdykella ornata]